MTIVETNEITDEKESSIEALKRETRELEDESLMHESTIDSKNACLKEKETKMMDLTSTNDELKEEAKRIKMRSFKKQEMEEKDKSKHSFM